MQPLILVLVFVFGAIIGSFLNALIWRLPREITMQGRSKCPNCSHTLTAFDLVPILSFLFLSGRCRYCKKPISPRYFLVEFSVGVLFVLAFLLYPLAIIDFTTLLALVKLWFAIALAVLVLVIDFEHFLILDKVVYPALLVAVAITLIQGYFTGNLFALHSNFIAGLLGAAVVSGFFMFQYFISKGTWIGFGDVKFALVFGFLLLWPGSLIGLLFSYWIGAIIAIPLLFLGKSGKTKLPFGVFLSLGMVIYLFFEKPISTILSSFFNLS